MAGGRKGTVYENAQAFNKVYDLYGISLTSTDEGLLKLRSPPNNDIVALCGIGRAVPIYRPIPDIAEGAMQKAAL